MDYSELLKVLEDEQEVVLTKEEKDIVKKFRNNEVLPLYSSGTCFILNNEDYKVTPEDIRNAFNQPIKFSKRQRYSCSG